MKVAFFQSDVLWENVKWNVDKASRWVEGLDADVDLCVFPEMFATGFSMSPEKIAQSMDGEIVNAMQQLAITTGKALIFSAAINDVERNTDECKYFNRLFFMAPDGARLVYDKRHLFRMSGENEHYCGGNQILIVHYKGWRICPMICYDLRFPAWSRAAKEADLLIYIASWPSSREYPWSTLLRARAIENQCFTLGVNRVGDDPGNHYSGNSVMLDFMGKPAAEATPDLECGVVAELNLDELRAFREKFQAWRDADKFVIED